MIRPGVPATFTVYYGNTGNTDVLEVPLLVSGIPGDSEVNLNFGIVDPPLPEPIPGEGLFPGDLVLADDGVALPLLIPVIPGGSTQHISFTLVVPTIGSITLRTSVSAPWIDALNPQLVQCLVDICTTVLGIAFPGLGSCIGSFVANLAADAYLWYSHQQFLSLTKVIVNIVEGCIAQIGKLVASVLPNWRLVVAVAGNVTWTNLATGAATYIRFAGVASITLPQLAIVLANLLDKAANIKGLPGLFKCLVLFSELMVNKLTVYIGGPRDPNFKVGPQGSGTQQYVSPANPLPYEIGFENQATATLPARQVVVTDQLDPAKVDLSTFSLGTISFGDTVLSPPPGLSQYSADVDLRPAENLIVRFNASLNTATGLVTWTFSSLDPATGLPPTDPAAGFLPPDVNPPQGEGAVQFTVTPKTGLASGTQISNQAAVVFDQNAPVVTGTWTNTIDASLPASSVTPLPATENSPDIQVHWSGTDSFSGISDFTVYVSVNGGPFEPWIDTSDTSATYQGQPGNTYAFYSQARSNVGTVENAKTTAEATTTVLRPTALTYIGPSSGDYDDAVTMSATLTDTSLSPALGLSGVPVTLTLGTQSCTGTTDTMGTATCSVTPSQTPGSVTVSASFAGNSSYLPSTAAPTPFTIGTEETALTITSPNARPANAVSVSATLLEDGSTVPHPGGQTVNFTATPSGGGSPVTGTGTIDATGTAKATLALPPGSYTLTASFAGDGFYQSATAGTQTLYVYQPTTFVIWGGNLPNPAGQPANVTAGQDYTFWGAHWAAQVQSGNFQANPSFKGFATSVSGAAWTSDPGASSGPPATVATYISVIVTTSATKNGNVESGNIAETVVLKVDNPAGYQPNPASPGSGILMAVIQ